jgi:carbonic anhydrase/acetyltransferase-like protein (isoleucine patch superfamily)
MSPANNSRIGKDVVCHNEGLVNVYASSIGDRTKVGVFSELGGSDIGSDCVIGAYTFISPGCRIGNFVFIGPKCALLNDLYPSIKGDDFIPNGVIIEDGAVLGACVTVLPGVIIGANARVGAGAVVTNNVPPNTTVIGFPAQEREDVWQPIDITLDIRNETLGPPSRPTAKDIFPLSPLAGRQHNIDSGPALSNDHPYSKLFEKERSNKEHGHLSTGSPYVKTTFKKEHECAGDCDRSRCDCSELPPAIDVTEWVGRADEPVYCRELPEGFDWEKAGIPKVTAERLRALIDADEELVLSKTKAHKKHRIPDRLPLDEESIGLGLGYWKEGQPKEKK